MTTRKGGAEVAGGSAHRDGLVGGQPRGGPP